MHPRWRNGSPRRRWCRRESRPQPWWRRSRWCSWWARLTFWVLLRGECGADDRAIVEVRVQGDDVVGGLDGLVGGLVVDEMAGVADDDAPPWQVGEQALAIQRANRGA